jgi:DNA-binding winged helix-turn-helix (wHTH) protein
LRFGVFEADVAAGELRKSGARIHLTGQPFQVLVLLLERDGGIVTREELRRVLWNDGTVVDFDRCLNTVINKLRETLGDSAETPRFVETIPRRGYRFLLPVQREVPEPPEPLPEPETPVTTVETPAAPIPADRSPRRQRWMIAASIGTAGAVAVGALALGWFRPAPAVNPSFALVPLTQFAGSEITPSLSPDGQQVAFAWNGESQGDLNLYVCAVGSDEPLRITNTPNSDFSPTYSPQGDQIAFYRRSGDSAAIHLVSPRGGTPIQLMGLHFGPPDPLTMPNSSSEQLSWSPDGKYLAFVDRASPGEPYSAGHGEIWTASAEVETPRCWRPCRPS